MHKHTLREGLLEPLAAPLPDTSAASSSPGDIGEGKPFFWVSLEVEGGLEALSGLGLAMGSLLGSGVRLNEEVGMDLEVEAGAGDEPLAAGRDFPGCCFWKKPIRVFCVFAEDCIEAAGFWEAAGCLLPISLPSIPRAMVTAASTSSLHTHTHFRGVITVDSNGKYHEDAPMQRESVFHKTSSHFSRAMPK